jgi:Protein of unknown function (DUF2800)
MSEHFTIAPSSLARTVQCPGSVVFSQKYGDLETVAADEGTAAHWVAMRYAMVANNHVEGVVPKLGEKIQGGFTVDKEMIAGAEMYAEALEGFGGQAEQTILIPRIHEKCGGTPDFWQYSKETKTLRVTDYKYGHKFVEIFENWQLIAYACGLVDMLHEAHELLEHETIVELLLVQPRCYHPDGPVRSWRVSASKLRALINIARAAAEDALGPNPKTKSGPECLYCPARGECKTAHIATTAIIEYAGHVEQMAQNGVEVGMRLHLINAALEMLKAVGSGLEEQALAMIRAGKTVPHFAIDYSKPRETWARSVGEVKALGLLYGQNLVTEEINCTPKQAVAKGIDRAVISKYSVTPNGKAKLVPDSLTKTARVFSK